MINIETARDYCREPIENIEGFAEAIKDPTQTWWCHHRLESCYTASELKALGCYYGRTACELIFLTPEQHGKTYHKGWSGDEARIRKSELLKGKPKSEEHNRKNSESHRGQVPWLKGKKRAPFSEEWKLKISEAKKGKHIGPHSEETKRRISEALKGKTHTMSEETKRKIRDSLKGRSVSSGTKGMRWHLENGKRIFTKE